MFIQFKPATTKIVQNILRSFSDFYPILNTVTSEKILLCQILNYDSSMAFLESKISMNTGGITASRQSNPRKSLSKKVAKIELGEAPQAKNGFPNLTRLFGVCFDFSWGHFRYICLGNRFLTPCLGILGKAILATFLPGNLHSDCLGLITQGCIN